MPNPEQLKEDLTYVMGAIERDRRRGLPRSIGLLWAAFALAGLGGLDWDPRTAGMFMLVASPILYLISWRLGKGSARAAGVRNAEMGRRYMMHWGSIFLAIGAITAMSLAKGLPGEVFGQMVVIVLGLVYFLAGVHLENSAFLWLGPLAMAGAAAISYVDRWGWTTLAVIIAGGILAATMTGREAPNPTQG